MASSEMVHYYDFKLYPLRRKGSEEPTIEKATLIALSDKGVPITTHAGNGPVSYYVCCMEEDLVDLVPIVESFDDLEMATTALAPAEAAKIWADR